MANDSTSSPACARRKSSRMRSSASCSAPRYACQTTIFAACARFATRQATNATRSASARRTRRAVLQRASGSELWPPARSSRYVARVDSLGERMLDLLLERELVALVSESRHGEVARGLDAAVLGALDNPAMDDDQRGAAIADYLENAPGVDEVFATDAELLALARECDR